MTFDVSKDGTTASAATTEKRRFLGITGLQYQPELVGLLENPQRLLPINGSGRTPTQVVFGEFAKLHAGLFRFVTALAFNLLLLAANARGNSDRIVDTDQCFGLFIRHDLSRNFDAFIDGNGA